jgi:topoisomerase-4 subunit B
MSPLQLRETTMAPDTRRLVQLTVNGNDSLKAKSGAFAVMDLLLAKKRAAERRKWLEEKGDLVEPSHL